MQHKFRFIADREGESNLWFIRDKECTHLLKVLRLQIGDEVEVFSLREPVWGFGTIESIAKKEISVRTDKLYKVSTQSPKIAIALGALSQNLMSDILPCLTELGVDEIHIFLQDQLSKARVHERSQERWKQILHSSMKQCRRVLEPKLEVWKSLEACLEGMSSDFSVYYMDSSASKALLEKSMTREENLCLFLGSEKGWSAQEYELLKTRNVQGLHMGPLILRSFTAIISAASLLSNKRNLIEKE